MALFRSKYSELSFYVDGKLYSFSGGSFSSDDPRVIEVASKLKDVQRVDTADKPTKQEEPKAEVKQDKQEPKKDKSKASAK